MTPAHSADDGAPNPPARVIPQSDAVRLFLDLSATLTGFTRVELLGTGMLQTFYDEVNLIIGEREMGKLLGASSAILPRHEPPAKELEALEAEVRCTILDGDDFGPIARNIIRLWYLGAWKQLPQEWRNTFGATSYDTSHIVAPQAYQESLVWVAGEAHPMGAKQQGFGAWEYPGRDTNGGRA